MKRAQRRINLNKLIQQNNLTNQNVNSGGNEAEERRVTRNSKRTAESSISAYFNKDNNDANKEQNNDTKKVKDNKAADSINRKRRLNLTRFLFKDKNDIPPNIRKMENDSDDFETPAKKIKKAPKLSQPNRPVRKETKTKTKATRQLKIESAFLRNEKIFSEIAAQHCIAENFNPDEVQLALAISRSEVELCTANAEPASKLDENGPGDCSLPENNEIIPDDEHIRAKLQQFGFRTAAKEDYAGCFAAAFVTGQKKRPKTKWANKFTALTLRDSFAQAKKLETKVNAFIIQQSRRKPLPLKDNQPNSPYKLHSDNLSKYAETMPQMQFIQNAGLLNPNQQLEKYFIDDLFPISKLPAGHLLKNWSVIPGRDLSPERISANMKRQNQKFQLFYAELENLYSLPEYKKSVLETNVTDATVEKSVNISNNFETNEPIAQKDKLSDDEKLLVQPIDQKLDFGLSDPSKLLKNCLIATTQLRATSPDLFADTDSDEEICVTNHLKDITIYETYSPNDAKNSSKVDGKGEMLSVKADVVIDLTQDDEHAVRDNEKVIVASFTNKDCILDFENCNNNSFGNLNDSLETGCVMNSQQKMALSKELSIEEISINESGLIKNFQTEDKDHNQSEEVSGSVQKLSIISDKAPTTDSIASSQLIASDNDDCDDDSCIVLSDDEINYSILRAKASTSVHNKLHVFSAELPGKDSIANSQLIASDNDDCDDDSCIMLSDDEINYSILRAKASTSVHNKLHVSSFELSGKDSIEIESSDSNDTPEEVNAHNFSVLEFVDKLESFDISSHSSKKYSSTTLLKNTSFDLNADREPINPEYLTSNSQIVNGLFTPKRKSIIRNSLKDSTDSPREVNAHNFSALEFVDKLESFDISSHSSKKSSSTTLLKNTSFDLNADREPINPEYLTSNSQIVNGIFTPTRRSIIRNSLREQHVEWKKTPNRLTAQLQNHTPENFNCSSKRLSRLYDSPIINWRDPPSKKQSFRKSIREHDAEFVIQGSISESLPETHLQWNETPTKQRLASGVVNCLSTPSTKQSKRKSIKEKHTELLGVLESQSEFFSEVPLNLKGTPTRLAAQLENHTPENFNHVSTRLSRFYSSPVINCLSTPSTKQSKRKSIKEQRAEFGILESQSESFSEIASDWKETPDKLTTELQNHTPVNINCGSTRLSRRCRSSQKFRSFLFDTPKLSNLNTNEPEIDLLYDDFDEFDRLVYGSPPKVIQTDNNIPTGLSQLLTAEISFNAHEDKTTADEEKFKEKTKKLSPEKHIKLSFEDEIIINDHVYSVRMANSPKPNFEQQSEAELLKQLYNFGIKPLKREQAIKILEYIYIQTHPILGPKRKSLCIPNDPNDLEIINEHEPTSPLPSSSTILNNTNNNNKTSNLLLSSCNSQRCENFSIPKNASKKLNLQDCPGDMLLRFSMELCAEFRNEEEIYIFQTNITKATTQPLLPLHVAWFNLICSNTELHENVLMYEPIDLQEIYLFLKSLGYRYDPKDLKNFFDRRCIIFRYNLNPPHKQKNRHIRQKS